MKIIFARSIGYKITVLLVLLFVFIVIYIKNNYYDINKDIYICKDNIVTIQFELNKDNKFIRQNGIILNNKFILTTSCYKFNEGYSIYYITHKGNKYPLVEKLLISDNLLLLESVKYNFNRTTNNKFMKMLNVNYKNFYRDPLYKVIMIGRVEFQTYVQIGHTVCPTMWKDIITDNNMISMEQIGSILYDCRKRKIIGMLYCYEYHNKIYNGKISIFKELDEIDIIRNHLNIKSN